MGFRRGLFPLEREGTTVHLKEMPELPCRVLSISD